MLEQYTWQDLSEPLRSDYIKILNPIEDVYPVKKESTIIRSAALSFYTNVSLIEVYDPDWISYNGPFWFLETPNGLLQLNGKSKPIHDANDADAMILTENTVMDYVRFFCFFVHNEDGPFFVVESADHPVFNSPEIKNSAKLREALNSRITALKLDKQEAPGIFKARCTVVNEKRLYAVLFSVTIKGEIEMLDDTLLAKDLPLVKIKPDY